MPRLGIVLVDVATESETADFSWDDFSPEAFEAIAFSYHGALSPGDRAMFRRTTTAHTLAALEQDQFEYDVGHMTVDELDDRMLTMPPMSLPW